MLCPKAISKASGKPVEEIKRHFQEKFALAIDDDGYTEPSPPDAIVTCDGKKIFTKETVGLEFVFNCNKYDVAKNMTKEEIADDIKVFLERVKKLFQIS